MGDVSESLSITLRRLKLVTCACDCSRRRPASYSAGGCAELSCASTRVLALWEISATDRRVAAPGLRNVCWRIRFDKEDSTAIIRSIRVHELLRANTEACLLANSRRTWLEWQRARQRQSR
jgi:hypothetical protein